MNFNDLKNFLCLHEKSLVPNVGIGTTTPSSSLDISTPAASRESIIRATVSDASGDVFGVSNATNTANVFAPSFYGSVTTTSTQPSLVFHGMTTAANDTGTAALVNFTAKIHSGDPVSGPFSSVTTRPLFSFNNLGTNIMTMLSNGNVGIGTTTPTEELEVRSDQNGPTIIRVSNSSTAANARMKVSFFDGTAEQAHFGMRPSDDAMFITNKVSGPLYLETNDTTRFTITSSGNIGIGTTTPLGMMHILKNQNAGTDWIIDNPNAGAAAMSRLIVGQDPMSSPWRGAAFEYYSSGFTPNGALKPEQSSIITWSGTTNGLVLGTAGASAPIVFATGASITERMRILATGNVGIGTTNPGYKLDVSGDLRITGTPYRTGGDIAWQVPSDARLKDVTGPYEHGLEDLTKLDMIRFRYKENNPVGADTSKEYIGVLAQDVQKVIPEAVKEDKDGFLSLNTTPIFWSMINAIKELYSKLMGHQEHLSAHDREIASVKAETALKADKAEMEALKAKNQKLEQENAEMKARLDKIEKMLNSK